MTLYCPFSGLEVIQNPEWQNVKISEKYEISLSIIGDRIVYNRANGFVELNAVEKAIALGDRVARHIGNGIEPYIFIEDFSLLEGASSDARRYYVNCINNTPRRAVIIFCNVSLPVKISIKIGKRLVKGKRFIQVVKNYQEAVALAMTLKDCGTASQNPLFRNILKAFRSNQKSLRPVELISKNRWQIKTPDYSNQAVLIDNQILHSSSTGFLKSKDVSRIDRFREQIQSELSGENALQYIVVNLEGFKAGSRAARFKYMQSLKTWYERFPFRIYIIYNANIFMRTALKLAKPMMPFKLKVANDLNRALSIVLEDRQYESNYRDQTSEHISTDIRKTDIDQLLLMIGNINWEMEGIAQDRSVPQGHPFFYIYEALKLIKEELDDLFQQRKRLESQLHQSRKMESVGRLAGGIAHDFNNILQMILGSAELAMMDSDPGTELHQNLDEIKMASLNGAGIVKQLLNFSRKSDPQIIPMDAAQIIKSGIDLIKSTIQSNITIKIDLSDEEMTVLVDPVQMNQVLMNICINASQEMETTGGQILISTDKEIVVQDHVKYISDLVPGEYLKVTIKDTGPGIDQKILNSIFDPYFTTKETGKGSGMGLSVVHGIVKNHNGLIMAESEPDVGSVFTVLLPLGQTKPLRKLDKNTRPVTGSESILFVDDEKTINRLAEKGMGNLGYSVHTCSDPEEALELFKLNPQDYDVVVTDMVMPKMTGHLLFEQLRAVRSDIPIIACTGYSSLVDGDSALKMGFSAFIMKPFPIEELATVIRSVVKQN